MTIHCLYKHDMQISMGEKGLEDGGVNAPPCGPSIVA